MTNLEITLQDRVEKDIESKLVSARNREVDRLYEDLAAFERQALCQAETINRLRARMREARTIIMANPFDPAHVATSLPVLNALLDPCEPNDKEVLG